MKTLYGKYAFVVGCFLFSCSEKRAVNETTILINATDWDTVPADTSYSSIDTLAWTSKGDVLSMDVDLGEAISIAAVAGNTDKNDFVIALPFQQQIGNFHLVASHLISPALQREFPDIKTFRGINTRDSSIQASIAYSPVGVSILVASAEGVFEMIRPVTRGPGLKLYKKHRMNDYLSNRAMEETSPAQADDHVHLTPGHATKNTETFSKERLYRIAVAATGEYTRFHNGKDNAFFALVTTLDHVSLIYERELGIAFQLVDDNDQLIFEDPATDGYTNHDAEKMNTENQGIIDAKIGNASYDIGHVFATAPGGHATIGSVCKPTLKARGASGLQNPIGDPFDIDFVAHEIGHQFGAHHIFNSNACLKGAREPDAAVEPGSGSTIMGYAGVCKPSENLQPNTSPYFNAFNLAEIHAYVSATNCANAAQTTNHVPVATVQAKEYWIPPRTPFALSCSGFDADADALAYCWEQQDIDGRKNGLALGTDDKISPVFRSFPPSPYPVRFFPQLPYILTNQEAKAEVLSNFNRDLRFVLTVRDYKGGYNFDYTTVHIVRAGGPFLITSQNAPATWAVGSTQTVTWSVGNTTRSPMNCQQVNILLSEDGGRTFPIVLSALTPNDGKERITVPDRVSSTARIKVEPVNGIFFDISNADISIIKTLASE